jgi:hypothetical protein
VITHSGLSLVVGMFVAASAHVDGVVLVLMIHDAALELLVLRVLRDLLLSTFK